MMDVECTESGHQARAAWFMLRHCQRQWHPTGDTVVPAIPSLPSVTGAEPSPIPQQPSLLLPSDQPMATTILATIGKFAASASFSTSYVYAAELFPTIVR